MAYKKEDLKLIDGLADAASSYAVLIDGLWGPRQRTAFDGFIAGARWQKEQPQLGKCRAFPDAASFKEACDAAMATDGKDAVPYVIKMTNCTFHDGPIPDDVMKAHIEGNGLGLHEGDDEPTGGFTANGDGCRMGWHIVERPKGMGEVVHLISHNGQLVASDGADFYILG